MIILKRQAHAIRETQDWKYTKPNLLAVITHHNKGTPGRCITTYQDKQDVRFQLESIPLKNCTHNVSLKRTNEAAMFSEVNYSMPKVLLDSFINI